MSTAKTQNSQTPFVAVRFVERAGSKTSTTEDRAAVRDRFIAVHGALKTVRTDILEAPAGDLSVELLQQLGTLVVSIGSLVGGFLN
jgi:hypothetical protein